MNPLYIGTFAAPSPRRHQCAAELDLAGGWRHTAASFSIESARLVHLPNSRWAGHTHRLRRGDLRLKYQLAPVTFVGTAAWSTDFLGRSGDGYYLEAAWMSRAGLFGVTLSAASAISGSSATRASHADYFLYSIYARARSPAASPRRWAGTQDISQSMRG